MIVVRVADAVVFAPTPLAMFELLDRMARDGSLPAGTVVRDCSPTDLGVTRNVLERVGVPR